MLFPNLPEKWKKLIPGVLTGGSIIALSIMAFFGVPTTTYLKIVVLVSGSLGLFLGINWTPPDPV